MRRLTKNLLGFFGVMVLISFDRLTKALAVSRLKGFSPFSIIDGVFELHYLENTGAAFGVLQNRRWFLLVITVLILAVLAVLYFFMPAKKRFFPLHLAAVLLASGAVGNMIDRIINGYVVDFFYFKLINFPIFNLADVYVVVSVIFAFLLICFYYKDEDFDFLRRKKKKSEKTDG